MTEEMTKLEETENLETEVIEVGYDLPPRPMSVPLRGHYTELAKQKRLEFLTDQTGVETKWTGNSRLTAEYLQGNIENFIGSVELPVGLAGPLLIKGGGEPYVTYPVLATTEGALVSSVARGCRVISDSGGCRAHCISQRMVRSPAFKFNNLDEAVRFSNFVHDSSDKMRSVIGMVSKYARLISVEAEILGRIVHTRFCYETGDAAGQNMTTKVTDRACAWLLDTFYTETRIKPTYQVIEGNTSGDKKITSASFQRGRGVRVTAEVELPEKLLHRMLNITAERLHEGHQIGLSGGVSAGMMGYNINVANVIAAMFVATGQDVACVHESSLGHLFMERIPGGLYVSMTLSNLVIGSVGGGTGLPGQREMLECLGCYGPGGVVRLAEVICATCLALDISTSAAVGAGDFAAAHARLGRRSDSQ